MKERDEDDLWIERRIVTGLVVSNDFMREVRPIWNDRLIESETARTIASWCLKHYDEYKTVPGRDIESIYSYQLRNGLVRERAESIELVLQSLSSEYEREQFNVPHLIDQTKAYLRERHLKIYADDIRGEVLSGNLSEAEKLACDYHPIASSVVNGIEPFSDADKIRMAFQDTQRPLIRFGKALGALWDRQLVRDAFVGFMAIEKLGKTWILIELAMRGSNQGSNVAFYQAGDLSDLQAIKRLCIYISQRNDDPRYCGDIWVPMLDCVNNQLGICKKKQREGFAAPFDANENLHAVSFERLVEALRKNPDHRPCRNCESNIGAIWLRHRPPVEPLTWKDAWRHITHWRRRHKKRFKLATYANGTLNVAEIKSTLDLWERTEGFVPDIVVVDYADLLAPDPDCRNLDHRNQQDSNWKRLRGLSQQRHCLVLTATQAAASGYEHDTLKLKDFSEDKRKYAHCTAMYGLNQSPREKQLGIMRINELVVREGDFDRSSHVKILQRLQIGRPFLGSFK